MYYDDAIWIASGQEPIYLYPSMANRHGLITGATGTGKTTTVRVLAESFSAMGVPVFLADVKGDLSGICQPGVESEKMNRRLDELGVPEEWAFSGFPTRFWDVFGVKGHPVRVKISDIGPTFLSRIMNLSEIQAGVLNLVFYIADQQGLELIDLKDLRAMLSYCAEHRSEFTTDYGNMSPQSIGAIQRSLLTLQEQGGETFFGEPELDLRDWIMCDEDGRGFINVLNSDTLVRSPLLYSTFLLWMLSALFEQLPEEGDMEIPKMVFFFDEAHLLFDDAPKALLDKVTQIVKLIRSKGIGIYFISQSPADIPDSVLGQLQNRVQHALHAYTPADQKAVKVAATTFRPNPEFSTEEAISNLGVGEALVSFLDPAGVPGIVEIAKILPPQSLLGPAPDDVIADIIANSEMEGIYREAIDKESAYEILTAKQQEEEEQKAYEEQMKAEAKAEAARQKEEAAALRKAEQEAARLERERRKMELDAIRELEKATGLTGGRRSTGSRSRSYSSSGYSSRSTGRTSTRSSYSSKRKADDYPPPPPMPEDMHDFGREVGEVIKRGIFGNRRF